MSAILLESIAQWDLNLLWTDYNPYNILNVTEVFLCTEVLTSLDSLHLSDDFYGYNVINSVKSSLVQESIKNFFYTVTNIQMKLFFVLESRPLGLLVSY